MRYPKHIILDIKSYPTSSVSLDSVLKQRPSKFSFQLNSPLEHLAIKSPLFPKLESKESSKFSVKRSLTNPLFTIHFLRKEKLYTKLKYSRCPQYDIVSGGFAAIFAGFIGFLISEKFGIELVDSGDFYNAFMYAAFVTLSMRPFLLVYSADNTTYHPLSPKYLLLFSRDLAILLLSTIKFYLKQFKY